MKSFLPLLLFVVMLPLSGLAQKGVTLPGEASKKVKKTNPAYAKVVDDAELITEEQGTKLGDRLAATLRALAILPG